MRFLVLGFVLSLQAFAELPAIRCGGDEASSIYYPKATFEEGIDDFLFVVRETNAPRSFVSHIKTPADHQMYSLEFRIPKLTREPGKPPTPNCFFTQSNGILFNCNKGAVTGKLRLTNEATGISQDFDISRLNARATETSRMALSSMDHVYERNTVDILFDGKTSVGEGKSILTFEKRGCTSGEKKAGGAPRPITRGEEYE